MFDPAPARRHERDGLRRSGGQNRAYALPARSRGDLGEEVPVAR